MKKNLLDKIPSPLTGEIVPRKEPCRICNEQTGMQVAVVDFWDISTARIIRCEKCHHIQLDQMLTEEQTLLGCNAYYLEESIRTGSHEQVRNCIRNFRRGVLFAGNLKKRKITPRNILEMGPGSGYFSAGVKFIFPETEITVMDINQDVLDLNSRQHGYGTIHSIPDTMIASCKEKFDLIIARDILEHVSDIAEVISNVAFYLKPSGHFHFITPNGHEDVWKHYLTSAFTGQASELLINHVNYFDGDGLQELLKRSGLEPVEYYTFGIKSTIKGAGWKRDRRLSGPVSEKKDATRYLREMAGKLNAAPIGNDEVLNQWYILKNAKWITRLYSMYQHAAFLKLSPGHNVGHEFYGLFIKSVST